MDTRDDQPPTIRYSVGAPPSADTPLPSRSAPGPRGSTPRAAAVGLVLAIGLGAGYLIFHKDAPGAPQSPKAAFQAWSDNGGKSRMDQFSTDIDALTTAASNTDTVGVRAACVSLQTDVESAQAYQPFPDSQAQASWAAALAAYARGAADCIAGTDRLDASLINQFNDELGTGNGDLQQVAARINQINGS